VHDWLADVIHAWRRAYLSAVSRAPISTIIERRKPALSSSQRGNVSAFLLPRMAVPICSSVKRSAATTSLSSAFTLRSDARFNQKTTR
jgi:hypothetical protein